MKTVRELTLVLALLFCVDTAFFDRQVAGAVGLGVREMAVWSTHAFKRGAIQQGWWS